LSFTLIQNTKDLHFLNEELLCCPYVGIDTEFRRTNKYNMKLALLQVNDTEEIYIIDCLKIKEPQINCSFLFSKNVKKILHSCKEDIEAIYSWTLLEIINIFDTQIASSFLDGPFSISYKDLVKEKLGITLDKKETRTNWLRRPLSEAQLDYAASDVLFLIELYIGQKEELIKQNKLKWFEEELLNVSQGIFSMPELESTKGKIKKITKNQERRFMFAFNEIVEDLSASQKINPTLFFSKQNQRDFLRTCQAQGIEEALRGLSKWRRNLVEDPISDLVSEILI